MNERLTEIIRLGATALVNMLLYCSGAAHACAVCMGAAESKQTEGMNAGLLTMLGVMSAVFGIGAYFVARMVWFARNADGGEFGG